MKTLIKNNKYSKYIIFVLPLPLILNNVLNFFNGEFYFGFQNTSGIVELYNLVISFFLFFVYLIFGKILKEFFKTKYISSSIVLFWLLVFGIDNTLLFFINKVSFKFYLLTIFILLFIMIALKTRKLKNLLKLIFAYIFLRFCFYILIEYVFDPFTISNVLFTSDEQILWYPALSKIFETNYYSVLINNPFPGYGLFTAYVGAINSFLLIGFNSFSYYLAINYLFLFLFFTFLYEISNEKLSYFFLFTTFLSIVLSSHWFTYVFFGSILSEVVSSFCFGVLFTEIVNKKDKFDNLFIFYILSFGFLYFSRQFLSTLVLIFIIYQSLKTKKIIILIGLYAFVIKFLQSIILPNTSLDPYINENEFSNILFNLDNVIKMINQFLIDKPVTYLTFIFVILILLSFKIQFKNIDYFTFITLNTLFVILLMIFIWRKDDVQSSYRYLMNVFYLFLYPMADSLDYYFQKRK